MARGVTEYDTGVKILYDQPNSVALDDREMVDIVAIHGIGAHPDDTWCKNVGSEQHPEWVNWLSDPRMLSSIVPRSRIMRYGYMSQWFGPEAIQQNTSKIAERFLLAIARERKTAESRSLIIIAHCLGGLVILKALSEAFYQPKEWPGIFESTVGLIFFGTPFRGSRGLSQSEMLQAALREYSQDQVHTEVLKILDPDNELLLDLVSRFGKVRQQSKKASIACFFELQASNISALVGKSERTEFIVSESSGCLDLSESITKYSVGRNHFNMNKFGKPTEEDFLTVRGVIEEMIDVGKNATSTKNATSCKHIRLGRHSGKISSVAFSKKGKLITSASNQNTVRLWDMATKKEERTLDGHDAPVDRVILTPDGLLAASVSLDNTVRVWDVSTGEMCVVIFHSGPVKAVAFSATNSLVASASSDKTVRVWNAVTKVELAVLHIDMHWATSVVFSHDGNLLASGSDYKPLLGNGDYRVLLWDTKQGALRTILKGHSNSVNSVAFSPDDKLIASASDDKTVILWDVATGEQRRSFDGHFDWVRKVVFSSDGKWLASASGRRHLLVRGDYTIRLWDLSTGAPSRELKGHSKAVRSIAFSDDGKFIASVSGDATVKIWNAMEGTLCRTIQGHSKRDAIVAFASCRYVVAFASHDDDSRRVDICYWEW